MSEPFAVEATSAAGEVGVSVESLYAPSWLHRLVLWIESLPVPAWIVYVAVWVASTLYWHLVPWSSGAVPVGTFDPPSAYWGFLAPSLLWAAMFLERTAAAAFEAFRPALTLSPAGAQRLRHELIVVPGRHGLAITLIAAVMTVVSIATDPVKVAGVAAPIIVGAAVIQTIYTAILFELLYRLVRQMQLIRRTLDRSVAIDLFRPGPLHAFAMLTSRPGMVISLLVAAALLFVPIPPDFGSFLVNTAPYLVLPPAVAIVAFVVPLTGVHAALVDRKERLKAETEERLKTILAGINRDVDGDDLSRADGLNKMLASIVQQRDLLAKLPTWPWSTGTLRAFVTAMVLPMVLFTIQLAIARVF